MDWRCSSRGRAPAFKHEALSSNPVLSKKKEPFNENNKYKYLSIKLNHMKSPSAFSYGST
jgi:hypothetical protein